MKKTILAILISGLSLSISANTIKEDDASAKINITYSSYDFDSGSDMIKLGGELQLENNLLGYAYYGVGEKDLEDKEIGVGYRLFLNNKMYLTGTAGYNIFNINDNLEYKSKNIKGSLTYNYSNKLDLTLGLEKAFFETEDENFKDDHDLFLSANYNLTKNIYIGVQHRKLFEETSINFEWRF
tara:strand:+ start:5423 stop:5971 length:549 start_codon:yes stop_codon:yes gene_type:complete